MLIDQIEWLHQAAHNAPSYDEATEIEDLQIFLSIARGELLLLILGLALVQAEFPCLYAQIDAFQRRLSELVDVQVPDDYEPPSLEGLGDDD